MHIIYSILNTQNNKQYIGRSNREFNLRYWKGKWWKYSSNKHLKSAANKYGKSSFQISILEEVETEAEAILAEKKYIKSLNTLHPNGYNLTDKIIGEHLRIKELFNNNTKEIWTLSNKATGDIFSSDSIQFICSKTGFSERWTCGNLVEGHHFGDWVVVEVKIKNNIWKQKYILFNVKTKEWLYETRKNLFKKLIPTGIKDSKLALVMEEKRVRTGDWVLYKNKNSYLKRKPKKTSKSYLLKSPDGKLIEISNLPKFCRDNLFEYRSFFSIITRKRLSHKGWMLPETNLKRISKIFITKDGIRNELKTVAESSAFIKCSQALLYNKIKKSCVFTIKGFSIEIFL